MQFERLTRFLFGIVGALLLTATSAGAHSGHTMTVTLADSTPGAYSNVTISVVFGAAEPDTMTIDFEAGWRLAHDDQSASEVTPNPNDEESIGSGSTKMAWALLLCGVATQTLTLTWEEDMTGAPAGAVAHWVLTNPLGFDTHMWVIEENDANDDYKIAVDFDQATTCSSASQPADASWSLTIVGTTASGGHPIQNPGTAGCYDVSVTWTEVGGTGHSSSVGVPIGSGTCP